jgi:hypothetical membrane protein
MKPNKVISRATMAGLLMFISGIIVFMGIITAEAYYPGGYSTATNEISDLGATRPPNSIIHQPSATIFNVSMVITGLLVLISTYLLANEKYDKSFFVALGLFGAGVIGVGLFPGNTTPHAYFALLTFLFGGIAAILSYRVTSRPFNVVAVVLGSVALIVLLFSEFFMSYLGDGGAERWIAYPISLWLTGMGGYLLGRDSEKH